MTFEVGPEAEDDVNRAAAFYRDRAEGLGQDFLDEVERVFGLIRKMPEVGPPRGKEIRRYLLQRFPYSVLYRVRDDMVVVVAVMHHRQRPGYWADRV